MTPSVTLPPSGAIQTGITNNWTRVRPAFFRGLAKRLEFAEDKIFGLILTSTVGHGKTWEKISWSDRVCNIVAATRRRCEQAISALLDDGLVRSRKAIEGNGTEYALAARPDGDSTGIAKCRGCGQTSEIDLDPEWIPVPHSFFLSLPAACDHGMYLVVKTVVERTMRWDKLSRQIVVIPCEITIEEFERATGKKRSEILQDMQKVQAAGCEFIGSEKSGRSNRYWARPENFANAPKRPKREVKQPKQRRIKDETEIQEKVTQPVESTKSIRPVEFVSAPCGVCRNCGCYGPVDMVDVVSESPKKPIANARAGPPAQILSSLPTFNTDHWKKKA